MDISKHFYDYERVQYAIDELIKAVFWESDDVDCGASEEEIKEHIKLFKEKFRDEIADNVNSKAINFVQSL